ncbi:hypothetical protein BGZ76_011128 [Entomortierella beljakovae]|nr:hypothetical protein BGZ76_011128 [Entomortierella beljakovae]
MVNATNANGLQLDQETLNKEIVASLRTFLKHQTERVSLYKEFNDAFKDFSAKQMTREEYATTCNIVTQGFVELSIEILALEAHLGGSNHVINASPASAISTANESTSSSSTNTNSGNDVHSIVSLNSPEHAQLIREVQLLEKQKLALTVQQQKMAFEKEAQEAQELKEREAELEADRIVGNTADEMDSNNSSGDMEGIETQENEAATNSNGPVDGISRLSEEEWQVKIYENKERLNEVVEGINEKLADIQEAIAILVL